MHQSEGVVAELAKSAKRDKQAISIRIVSDSSRSTVHSYARITGKKRLEHIVQYAMRRKKPKSNGKKK